MNQTTLAQFISRNQITMAAEWRDSNPQMPDFNGTHWSCRLRCNGRQMTIAYSMGYAHTGEPELADVLDCLASDASGYENARDFQDWASEYGYDTDRRKAERTYNAVKRQSRKLRNLLGDQYDALLWNTERQ